MHRLPSGRLPAGGSETILRSCVLLRSSEQVLLYCEQNGAYLSSTLLRGPYHPGHRGSLT